MSKYKALNEFLKGQVAPEVTLSFDEINEILGAKGPGIRVLPESAYQHSAWWANERTNDSNHVQCHAWLDAHFKVHHVELGHQVVFHRIA